MASPPPKDRVEYLDGLDEFIEREINPLEQSDDNERFFDHRREDARADWDRGGLPNEEGEGLLAGVRRRADAAGHYRDAFPKEDGGRGGAKPATAGTREALAGTGGRPANALAN